MAERIIQLATNYDKLSARAKKGLFDSGYASEKLDGVWMVAVCTQGNIKFLSSTLEEYISFNKTQLEEDIRELHVRGWTDFALIGEVYKEGMAQQAISGIARTEKEGYADSLEFHVHDILQLSEWVNGESLKDYSVRLEILNAIVEPDLRTASLKVIEQVPVHSEAEFLAFSKAVKTLGGEGAIYRSDTAGWQSGNRGTNLIRDKRLITYDLEVTRVGEVSEGDKGGLKGVIYVRWRKWGSPTGEIEDQPVRGMTHAQLRAWAEDPSLIVGKVVEVHAMRLTNLGTLREPRFKFIREDKEKADL